MATIESNSALTANELDNACKASIGHRSLNRQSFSGMTVGDLPTAIISYVTAFATLVPATGKAAVAFILDSSLVER